MERSEHHPQLGARAGGLADLTGNFLDEFRANDRHMPRGRNAENHAVSLDPDDAYFDIETNPDRLARPAGQHEHQRNSENRGL